MADSVIQVLEFNPINPLAARKVWELNQRDHRKLLIVVRRRALLRQAAVALAQDVAAPGHLGERGSGLAAQLALLHGPEIALLLLGGKKS